MALLDYDLISFNSVGKEQKEAEKAMPVLATLVAFWPAWSLDTPYVLWKA